MILVNMDFWSSLSICIAASCCWLNHTKLGIYFKGIVQWYSLSSDNSYHYHVFYCIYMTASQLNPSFECGEGMKVKVVKWCWKKWNWPILMHIYDKQCEIMQKNQWKSPNIQIQCFYNGTVLKTPKKTQKLEKLKRKLLKILKRYDLSRVVPCESWRPELSENVVVFEDWRF